MIFGALLAFIPISLALKYVFGASALVVFATSAIAVASLAEWVRRATDQIATRVGPAIGGLLTVSFGSVAELVLAVFVLMRGQASVVQAQIAGSILATSLFGLGLAMIIGGATRDRQHFKPERAGLLSSLLVLVVIALLLPAVFDVTGRVSGQANRLAVTDEEVSLGVSGVLLVLYFANLVYTLVTHRDVFSAEEPEGGTGWSTAVSLAVLIAATAAIALEVGAHFLSARGSGRSAEPSVDVSRCHCARAGWNGWRSICCVLVCIRGPDRNSFSRSASGRPFRLRSLSRLSS